MRGFADLSLGPLGYRAESLSIANLAELPGHPQQRRIRQVLLFLGHRENFCLAQKSRRFFRGCWIDIKARAPFKARDLCQLRNNFDVPVVVGFEWGTGFY